MEGRDTGFLRCGNARTSPAGQLVEYAGFVNHASLRLWKRGIVPVRTQKLPKIRTVCRHFAFLLGLPLSGEYHIV